MLIDLLFHYLILQSSNSPARWTLLSEVTGEVALSHFPRPLGTWPNIERLPISQLIDIEVGVDCEDSVYTSRFGSSDKRGISEVHGSIAVTLHESLHSCVLAR